MTSSTQYQAAGLALITPAPLAVIFGLLHPPEHRIEDMLQPGFTQIHLLAAIAYLAILLALPSVYGRYSTRLGWLGLIGYVVYMLGTAYMAFFMTSEAFLNPLLARSSTTADLVAPGGALEHGAGAFGPLGLLASLLGPALFGAGLLRTNVAPRPAAWLLVAYLPLAVPRFLLEGRVSVPYVIGPVSLHIYVLMVGVAWIGYWLLRETSANHAEVSRRVPLTEGAAFETGTLERHRL